jgi:S-methylmethionine-dependent homocysteine/selenocysteine methylase
MTSDFPLRDTARRCVDVGASAVLVNCLPAKDVLDRLEQLAELGVPFGAYANAGDERDGYGWGADPELAAGRYEELARRWIEAGATIVGGCCGTGPAHIARLAHCT